MNEATTIQDLTADEFMALRNEWIAAGRPVNHRYFELPLSPRAKPVEPLVLLT